MVIGSALKLPSYYPNELSTPGEYNLTIVRSSSKEKLCHAMFYVCIFYEACYDEMFI